MIEAQQLTRRYGEFVAVDGVSFSVQEGEIVGILGPNGAGKTTTIRMITGFLPPSQGAVQINGKSLNGDSVAARRDLGYLPETVALYPEMRVDEYLTYRGRLEGMTREHAKRQQEVVVERCLLGDVRQQIIGTLSKGFRQRVGLAAAILHEPTVLVLDEPTVGLDPKQIVAIRELIRELGRERTLLLSTHILPEVELLCDRVIIFDRGKIVAEGSPADLRRQASGKSQLRIELSDVQSDAGQRLAVLPGVSGVRPGETGREWVVESEGEHDPREAVFRCAVEQGWVLLEMSRTQASLEDVFVRLTTGDEQAEPVAKSEPTAAEEAAS